MRPQLIMGSFGIFIVGTMLCALASGRWLIGGETNIFNAIAGVNALTVTAAGNLDILKFLGGTRGFVAGVVTMLTWN